MLLYIREYIIILLTGLSVYSLLKIYLQSRSFITESDKIKRESIVIHTKQRNKELSCEIEGIIIKSYPDEVYEAKNGDLIVIEYNDSIREKDIDIYQYQMGTHFLILEAKYHRRPAYGIVENRKTNRTFKIENTFEIKKEIQQVITKMKNNINKNNQEIKRDHEDPVRCQHCVYRVDCIEALLT